MLRKEFEELKGKGWMLAKISNNQERLKSFVAGEVYMNPLSYYINLEKETGIKGQGDKLEASQYFKDVTMTFKNPETGETIPFLEGSEFTIHSPERTKTPVFCMMSIDLEVLEVFKETDEYIEFVVSLPKEKIEQIIKEFGEFAVIVPLKEFKEKLDRVIEEKGGFPISGKVNYQDYSKNYKDRIQNYSDLEHPLLCFDKCDSFKHQNEYRFLMEGISSEKGISLNVGDLSDIARELTTKDLFSGSIKLRFNKVIV